MQNNQHYQQILKKSFYESYENDLDLWSKDDGLTDIASLLLENLPAEKNHRILDIGAGNGRHCELFVKQGCQYTGVDLYKNKNWQIFIDKYGDKVQFFHTTFLEWETQHTFTSVLDNGCFHHQDPEEYKPYLRKIHHVLDPKGSLMLGLYTVNDEKEESGFSVMPSGKYKRVFHTADIQPLLEETGFRLMKAEKVLVPDRNRYYLAALAIKA